MWSWLKTGIFSILGGIAVGFAVNLALRSTGDSAIGSAAKALVFGVPLGNVLSAGLYRQLVLRKSVKKIILGGFLGLILSSFGALGGLYTMDLLGGYIGLVITLLLTTIGSVGGYATSAMIIGSTTTQ